MPFFMYVGDRTQDLANARQALSLLSYILTFNSYGQIPRHSRVQSHRKSVCPGPVTTARNPSLSPLHVQKGPRVLALLFPPLTLEQLSIFPRVLLRICTH